MMNKNPNIEAIYPLSPGQAGILFHTLYTAEQGLYFQQMMLTLEGRLDGEAFEAAWQTIMLRHDILRAFIVWEKIEKPHQVVVRSCRLPIERHDWRCIDPVQQEKKLAEFLVEDRKRRFDLTRPPLFRLTLIRMAEERHELVMSFHHLLLDGWSMGILFREMIQLHEGGLQGSVQRLERPSSYREYVEWIRRQDLSTAERYWREKLRGFTSPTSFIIQGSEGANNAAVEGDYHELERWLPPARMARIQAFTRQHRLTLNTLIQGIWGLLLVRQAGARDVVFGTVVSGRPTDLPGAEAIVGLLINTLPVRLQVDWNEPLLPWLRRLQDQLLEINQFEHSPLVEVQGWSEAARGKSLFDSIVAFENYPLDEQLFGSSHGLRIHQIRATDKNNYPLTLLIAPGAGLTVKLIYRATDFEAEYVETLLDRIETMLEAMLESPSARLGLLPYLSETERSRMVSDWNLTDAELPRYSSLLEYFEQLARQIPDATALIADNAYISYRELNRRANRMAHFLRGRGIGPESVVGICMRRSPELLVGVLGILKAGGAYLPLDPAYPSERIGYMLADARAELVLCERASRGLLPTDWDSVLILEEEQPAIDQLGEDAPLSGIQPANAALIIYTSGTTGRPKGVVIEHRNVLALLNWAGQVFSAAQLSCVLAGTSVCFDLSVFEFFATLSFGGRIVLVENILSFTNSSHAEQVSLLNTVPSAITEVAARARIPANVKIINLAGEPLPHRLAQHLLEDHQVETVFNLYGPSEDTTYSTGIKLGRHFNEGITIGRPISNTQVYILDERMDLLPAGQIGEICIAGMGLSRGYLHQPELTSERFLPDLFRDGRIYRSGDLGRYLPDGKIQIFGRRDHQIKIRGYRVEPEEIEDALHRHVAISKAVVMARAGEDGGKRLVAYIVADNKGAAPSAGELQRFLRGSLPDYMIPEDFLQLDQIPLTANGKLDRNALPNLGRSRTLPQKESDAPRNRSEALLAEIWGEVLRNKRVGIHDNFFELGGNSLLVMQITARIQKVFKVELSLREFFGAPTVAEQLRVIAFKVSESKESAIAR